MNQSDFGHYFMQKFETGVLSLDRADNGNFFKGAIVGSKWGVTGAVLARHRGHDVTQADMAALSLAEATDIFLGDYYFAPKFDQLPWDQVIASLVDFEWGTSAPGNVPKQATKCFQRMLDVGDDGLLGPKTIAAYKTLVAKVGLECVAGMFLATRDVFYELVISKAPVKVKYEKGWDARSFDYAPNTLFWKGFHA